MIYTCTLNPAIDMFVEVETLKPNAVNRSKLEDYQANGKTINISIILKRMGIDSVALGFIGGFTGEFIEKELKRMGIQSDFICVDGITRINTFIRENENEYKVVNKGPIIPEKKVEEMLSKISLIPSGSVLFVSGSNARGVSDDIYVKISKIAHQNNLKLILDISSKSLLDCLSYKPFLIKPNDEELACFFNKVTVTDQETEELGEQLLRMGSQNVLISKGDKGSILLSDFEKITVTSPKGKVINTACAGDSLLASFIGRIKKGDTREEALRYASAVGSSTAFSIGLSDLSDVEKLMEQVDVRVYEKEPI